MNTQQPLLLQQDTYSLKTRCGSSEDTSCPTFPHEFTALTSNEESEDFTLKINTKKRQENKTIYRFNMKGGHEKVKVFVLISCLFLDYAA